MLTPFLEFIDYIIMAIYILFVVWLGIFLSRQSYTTEKDYFLAGRNLRWPVVGVSLFATNIGAISLVGLAESGYTTGFAVFSYEWMAVIVLIILAIFYLPLYLKNEVYTIPEFLEKRYGSFARYYFSAVTIFLNTFVDIAAGLFAGAVLLKMVFPNVSISTIIWGISAIAAIYTLFGGLSTVVYSDIIQAMLMVFSSMFLAVIAYEEVGGWGEIVKKIDAQNLTIIRPSNDATLPWTGLFGVFLLGFYFWVNNQMMVQRVLSAKDLRNGQWGAIWAGALKLLVLFLMILPGVIAFILFPNLEDPKNAYPTLVFKLMPTGLLGLTIAGFISALMSSVDSGLHSVSTLFTFDFYKKRYPNATPKQTIKVAKITIVVVMAIAALWAPFINTFSSFWDYLQMVLSFICPPVVALFIAGIFTKKVNTKGANATIIVGIVLSLISLCYKFYIGFSGGVDILPHYLYLGVMIFGVCLAVLFIVSAMTGGADDKDWDKLLWTKADFDKETLELKKYPFYSNYRYQAMLLLAVMIALLIIF